MSRLRVGAPRHLHVAVTSSVSTAFFDGQLSHLRAMGWLVDLSASPDVPGQLTSFAEREGVRALPLLMRRAVRPLSDVRSACTAVRLLRRTRPTITNVGTPKCGLLVGLAAWATRVPIRVYTVHGLRYTGITGRPQRWLLKALESLAMRAANHVVCVSPSLRDDVLAEGLARPAKVRVLGHGSVNGVAVPDEWGSTAPAGIWKVGFVGRLTKDKGIPELVTAFARIREVNPSAELHLFGMHDETDPVDHATQLAIGLTTSPGKSGIVTHGHVVGLGPQLRQLTVLVLPSHREGLPAALLEAQAHGIPVVSTGVTGSRDAFVPGETGLEIPVSNPDALAAAVIRVCADPGIARALGERGRAFVATHFARELAWGQWADFYEEILTGGRSDAAHRERSISDK